MEQMVAIRMDDKITGGLRISVNHFSIAEIDSEMEDCAINLSPRRE
jgi:hypothetical protein